MTKDCIYILDFDIQMKSLNRRRKKKKTFKEKVILHNKVGKVEYAKKGFFEQKDGGTLGGGTNSLHAIIN